MDSALKSSMGYYFLTKLQCGESKLVTAVATQFGVFLDLGFFFLIFESDKFSLNVASTGLPTQQKCVLCSLQDVWALGTTSPKPKAKAPWPDVTSQRTKTQISLPKECGSFKLLLRKN